MNEISDSVEMLHEKPNKGMPVFTWILVLRELVEKIVVYAPDKSNGHRQQQIDRDNSVKLVNAFNRLCKRFLSLFQFLIVTCKGVFHSRPHKFNTANFKTRRKSYKNKKKVYVHRSEWLIFENTHPAIISQHDFDLVSELRRNKRKIQKCGEVNPFSGMVYCAVKISCSRSFLAICAGPKPSMHI
mgnify:CR=1 FL=1